MSVFRSVVSIDLFLVSFMPFSYNGGYFRPAPQVSYPIPPPPLIWSAQSIILHAQTQCYFVNICKLLSVLSFAGKKPDSFHTVNKND